MFGVKILEEKRSRFNGTLKAIKSLGLGTYIQSDGLTQSGGVVKEIWRRSLKKVKEKHHSVKSCLILGFGGGTAAFYIRKYWPQAMIVGYDIDPEIIKMGKKYLKSDETKAEIIIADAFGFKGKYDLLLIDLYKGSQFPTKFGDEKFVKKVKNSLNSGGVALFNRLLVAKEKRNISEFETILKKVFCKVFSFKPLINIVFIGEK